MDERIEIKWREQAHALFFIDHLEITEIAVLVGKARETVSRYINDLENYSEEMAARKHKSTIYRNEYKKEWNKNNRVSSCDNITKETLRREHEIASIVLSKDRY